MILLIFVPLDNIYNQLIYIYFFIFYYFLYFQKPQQYEKKKLIQINFTLSYINNYI